MDGMKIIGRSIMYFTVVTLEEKGKRPEPEGMWSIFVRQAVIEMKNNARQRVFLKTRCIKCPFRAFKTVTAYKNKEKDMIAISRSVLENHHQPIVSN